MADSKHPVRDTLVVAGAVVVMFGAVSAKQDHHHHHGGQPAVTTAVHQGHAVAQAIAYARDQLGKPYCWGGTGQTGCFDCSGLVMMAYQSAGVDIERTSQAQWASLPHVSSPKAGDLVFAVGALQPGETSPGHVGLMIGKHTVIQAYATGYPINEVPLHTFLADAGGLVGYARPVGGA